MIQIVKRLIETNSDGAIVVPSDTIVGVQLWVSDVPRYRSDLWILIGGFDQELEVGIDSQDQDTFDAAIAKKFRFRTKPMLQYTVQDKVFLAIDITPGTFNRYDILCH